MAFVRNNPSQAGYRGLRNFSLACLLVAGLAAGDLQAAGSRLGAIGPHGVTERQAMTLLSMVVEHQRIALPKAGLFVEIGLPDGGDRAYASHYEFNLVSYADAAGKPQTHGRFAVNRHTGDVWDLQRCGRIEFPRLVVMQQVIMRRTQRLREPMTADEVAAGEAAAWRRFGCYQV